MSDKNMHQKDNIRVVIIGAGKIASGFDMPRSKKILTHAHAVLNNSRMQLVGFYDSDAKASKKAAKKWRTNAFQSFFEISQVQPDVIIVATPDSTHASVVAAAAALKPKLIICEKPLGVARSSVEAMMQSIVKFRTSILVNYSYLFDDSIRAIGDMISKKNYGSVISASGVYTKGIQHNGSHLISLCHFLFGSLRSARISGKRIDATNNDPTVSGVLSFDRCLQFHLIAGDERYCSIFELDILCERARITIADHGRRISIRYAVKDTMYPSYTVLGPAIVKRTNIDASLSRMIQNAVDFIDADEPLFVDSMLAYATHTTCAKLYQLSKKL